MVGENELCEEKKTSVLKKPRWETNWSLYGNLRIVVLKRRKAKSRIVCAMEIESGMEILQKVAEASWHFEKEGAQKGLACHHQDQESECWDAQSLRPTLAATYTAWLCLVSPIVFSCPPHLPKVCFVMETGPDGELT